MDQDVIVVRIEGNHAFVEAGGANAGCGRCHEAGGCQSSVLGQLFGTKPRQFRVLNLIGAVPGEHVIVRIAEGAPMRAALLAYAVPVLFLLAGAIGGSVLSAHQNSGNDTAAALGGLGGLLAGVLVGLAFHGRRTGKTAAPVLLRRGSTFCPSKETCR